jgi:hypothetical protein
MSQPKYKSSAKAKQQKVDNLSQKNNDAAYYF